MPSSAWPRSLIISSTSSVPTESRTRFFRAKEISYTSFFSQIYRTEKRNEKRRKRRKGRKKREKEMTSFSHTDINTIGFSYDCIRRTLRVSRHSLAVPDTVNIPPSQLVAWIETIYFTSSAWKIRKKNKNKKSLTWL